MANFESEIMEYRSMKIKLTAVAMVIGIVALATSGNGLALRTGDLLFKEYPADSAFTDAVVAATSSLDAYRFSHVGVAVERNGGIEVIEAVFSGVKYTPLDSFLLTARHIGSQPVVMAARLKEPYLRAIPDAVKRMEQLVGKPYDREFLPGNDAYYCSELIESTFIIDGKPIFEAQPMTFKDKTTEETSPLWIRYFDELQRPIPEGVPGTNPGAMSRAECLQPLGLIPGP